MLKVETCCKAYRVGAFGGSELLAVHDVSFEVAPGEVVALIGESGSGKSTIGKMILRLLRVTRGSIVFDGGDISSLQGRRLKEYYADVQGVFQDPFSSYNPIFKADRVFAMLRHEYFPGLSGAEWQSKLEKSLDAVSLNPADVLNKYPHQLSGGQLQRMLIARALLLDIRLLVADEIISMLDASTRIDVLNLLGDLKSRGLGILFITHDLNLGSYISDRTMILRSGAVALLLAGGASVRAAEQAAGLRVALRRSAWLAVGRDLVGQRVEATVARHRWALAGGRAELDLFFAEGRRIDAQLRAAAVPQETLVELPALRVVSA